MKRSIASKSRQGIGAVGVVVACVVLAYWKVVFTRGYTYFWGVDLGGQYYPWYQFAGWTWKSGSVPLWDPFIRGGKLFFDEMQPGAFYPLNLLLFLTPARNGGVDLWLMDLLIVISVVLAGIGEYLLLRHLKISRIASIVGSCIFSLGGYTAFVVGHQAILGGVIWLPWIVLTYLNALESRGLARARSCLLSGFLLGVALLAGHIQPPAHTCLVLGFFTLGYIAARERTGIDRVKAVALMVGTASFALAVAAIQLIPSYCYSLLAYRWSAGVMLAPGQRIPFELQEVWSPAEYLSFLVPSATSHQFYLGIGTLFLACAGVVVSNHRFSRLFALGMLLSFFYSWGRISSLYSSVYVLVPLIEKVPEAVRSIFVLQFFLAGLAAMGTEVVCLPLAKHLRRKFVITANLLISAGSVILAVFLGVALWHARQIRVLMPDSFLPYSTAAALMLLWGGLFWARRHGLVHIRAVRAAVVLFVAFDLTSFVQSHTPQKTAESSDRAYAETGTTRYLEELPGNFRVVDLDGSLPLNFGDAYRIQTVHGYGASLRKDYHDFINSRFERDKAMRLLNVKYYVSRKEIPGMRLLRRDEQTGVSVYEDPLALPRLAFVSDGQAQDSARIGEHLLGAKPANAEAQIVSYEPNQVVIRTEAATPGFLWLSELAYPGWRVFVDGGESRLVVSDSIFRCVRLSAGTHLIRFVFRPVQVYTGAAITLLACLSLATLASMRSRSHGGSASQTRQ